MQAGGGWSLSQGPFEGAEQLWSVCFDGDRGAPCAVAFGASSGLVLLSRDEGESWGEVAAHLPTVLSVEFMGQGAPLTAAAMRSARSGRGLVVSPLRAKGAQPAWHLPPAGIFLNR